MSTPSFPTEAGKAGRYPGRRFDRRERKLAQSAKTYIDAQTAAATPADGSVTTAKLANGAVTLAKLAPGVTPAYVVAAAGKAAVTGSVTTQTVTVAGMLSTDLVFAQMNTADTTPVTISDAAAGTGSFTVTYSGTSGTGGNLTYFSLRAAS